MAGQSIMWRVENKKYGTFLSIRAGYVRSLSENFFSTREKLNGNTLVKIILVILETFYNSVIYRTSIKMYYSALKKKIKGV